MRVLVIELEAYGERHAQLPGPPIGDPQDFKPHPSLRINVYEMDNPGGTRGAPLTHGCLDISSLPAEEDDSEARVNAEEYLENNWKEIMQAASKQFHSG